MAQRTNSNRGSLTRRSFFRGSLVGALVCYLRGERTSLRAASSFQPKRYDLLINGGQVIDPSQDLSAARDIAIFGHKIAKVATDIPEADAQHVLDVRGTCISSTSMARCSTWPRPSRNSSTWD